MFARLAFCLVAFLVLYSPVAAQSPAAPVMVVDFERVFVETLYGQRIAQKIAEERERVQADNDRIAAQLLAEETALREGRASMDPAAFREAARAFDDRAQRVRANRQVAQNTLLELRDTEREQFLERIRPVVLALMLERGALVAMDRRSVIAAIGAADATNDAIALIDTTLGDGALDPSERPTLRPRSIPDMMPLVSPMIPDLPSETPDALPRGTSLDR